ncbi:MAG: plasmid pRiA4b ORF-3 family protein [Candidatus Hydrogenedens sp.]|jgi:hypothetical protein|nr:plasmid pRiA4b ORF-3 family protein [Candidatus Hydrogenedens sp.]
MDEHRYLLKIKLKYIEPEIWRRFVVPGFFSLDRLHDVIQIIMGWQSCHLYEFEISGKHYIESPEFEDEGLDVAKYRLMDLIKAKGRSFQYIYDFGDCWEHEIRVEDKRYIPVTQDATGQVLGRPLVECLDGARACPPEDVGSVPGYYEFCEAIKNPKHKEHRAMKEWISYVFPEGKGYDSEKFDMEAVNGALLQYLS